MAKSDTAEKITSEASAKVDYTLPIEHEHAGILHPAGTKLGLYPDQIARIEAHAKSIATSAH